MRFSSINLESSTQIRGRYNIRSTSCFATAFVKVKKNKDNSDLEKCFVTNSTTGFVK